MGEKLKKFLFYVIAIFLLFFVINFLFESYVNVNNFLYFYVGFLIMLVIKYTLYILKYKGSKLLEISVVFDFALGILFSKWALEYSDKYIELFNFLLMIALFVIGSYTGNVINKK